MDASLEVSGTSAAAVPRHALYWALIDRIWRMMHGYSRRFYDPMFLGISPVNSVTSGFKCNKIYGSVELMNSHTELYTIGYAEFQ